jgi:hypothetical protein
MSLTNADPDKTTEKQPIGRDFDISAYVGTGGLTCNMYYSRSIGAFAGFSLEGAILISRWGANKSFYGQKVKVKDVLNGNVPVPDNKLAYFNDFHQLLLDFEHGKLEKQIVMGSSSSSAGGGSGAWPWSRSSSGAKQKQEQQDHAEEEEQKQELLLHMSALGETGKGILKSSLDSSATRVVFESDHVIDETDPANQAYGIIGALEGDTAILLEGNLETGLGGALEDYVRVRVNHSGVEREGLVSRHILRKL